MKVTLRELSRRRELRIPGFMKKYVYSEYWKSIVRILLIKDNNLISFSYKNILFINIDKRTYSYLISIERYNCTKVKNWSVQKKNIFNLFSIYFPKILRPFLKKYQEVIFSTDINIANYNMLRQLSNETKKICVQHGYFPVSHKGDIDGLNADKYILRSESQKKILIDEGYLGEFYIKKLYSKKFLECDPVSGLVIVGPGFEHDKRAEKVIYDIALVLKKLSSKKISYRPHPRCSNFLREKIHSLDIKIDNSHHTDVHCLNRTIFLGVKSTMLLDAQEIGHISILIEHPHIPKYFPNGEIKFATSIKGLEEIYEI